MAALLLVACTPGRAAPDALPGALSRLGDQAIAAFDRQLDPAPVRITLRDWWEREAGVLERTQMRRLYGAAVAALLAHAAGGDAGPDRVFEVRAALDELVHSGRSLAADRLFAAQAEAAQARGDAGRREAAQAWRDSIALAELPVALATRGGRPDARRVLRGRSQLPLGALALPALRSAAALDDADPWTWILLGALGADDAALPAALRTAMGDADDTTALAAAQQMAQLMARQGRVNDAAQAHAAAVARAERALAHSPREPAAAQNLAFALHRRAEFEATQGQPQPARETLQRTLLLREELAAADPDDPRRQWDLVATHSALAKLPAFGGATNHLSHAIALASALNERDRFVPMLDANAVTGMGNLAIRVGGGLTLVIGLALLALYRARVGRWMRAAAAAGAAAAPVRPAAAAADPRLAPSLHPWVDSAAGRAPRSRTFVQAAATLRQAGLVQLLAGLAFALAAAALSYRLGNLILRPWAFAITVWAWLMPLTIVLCMLWTGDRRRQAAVLALYAAAVAGFCLRIAWSETPPLSVDARTLLPVPLQLLLLALPTQRPWPDGLLVLPAWGQPLVMFWLQAHQLLPALLFLSRHVRAAAPVLLTLLIVLCAGGVLASVAFSTWAGMRIVVQLVSLGLPVAAAAPVVFLAGALLAVPLAWLAGRGLAAAHRAKWLNDQSLVFDTIWLFQTLFLVGDLSQDAGAAGLLGFAAFAAYKTVTLLGMSGAARRARARAPARLLLLRVFGHRSRSERLLDVLAARWRYGGPIQMIGAPDVATRTVDPDEFMDFLSGRLRRRFTIEPQDLARRIADIDQQPDADGRFRINELFCGNDTWLAAVRALMGRSDLCLMDLRGFARSNSGCIAELQALLELVPARAIVLLVDRSTDQPLLAQTLHDCQTRLPPGSVNAGGAVALATLDASGRDLVAVHRILGAADGVLSATPSR